VSAAVRHEINARLVGELDAVEARQTARLVANFVEYRRRVDIAEAFIEDALPCSCTPLETCPRHYLLRVLQGDE
jgi:predicted RNA polymerase sigma factor